MTQPAFSRRIMAFEEWPGVDLFDRGSKPPRLTETGLWFRQVAQDLLAGATNQCSKESIHFLRIVYRILAVKAGKDGIHPIKLGIIQGSIRRRRHIKRYDLRPLLFGITVRHPFLLNRKGQGRYPAML